MSPKSNGYGYIVHGRCALTSWVEARPLKSETGKAIAQWLFEDIICRWGCIKEIVTDNGSPFKSAVEWLAKKYGVKGIRISPYNSRANGKIERPHWDIRQMLYKATGGSVNKWYWFFHHVLWADRISVRKGLGCSPFFMVTSAHPTLPLDIQEATWLVELPGRILTTEELIGYRAQALAKHREHIEKMRARVDKIKRDTVARIERDNQAIIKDYNFKKGDLVLIRNTEIESSLDKKMKPRYLGPMIVISRPGGNAYMVAEMDGSLWQQKVAAFRVIPYYARKKIDLPDNIEEITGISKHTMKLLEEGDIEKKDYNFEGVRLNNTESDSEDSEEE
jgi:hypothetical protein